jgi:hypothetical protein
MISHDVFYSYISDIFEGITNEGSNVETSGPKSSRGSSLGGEIIQARERARKAE